MKNKKVHMTISATCDEHKAWRQKANELGLSMTDLVRSYLNPLCNGYIEPPSHALNHRKNNHHENI